MTSTWRPCVYGSSSLSWPCTLDCPTHAACTLLGMLKGGCTLDGIVEGQPFPCHQLQRDKPSLTGGQHVPRVWTSLPGKGRDRESQIHRAGRKSKQTKWEGNRASWQTGNILSNRFNTTSLAHCHRHFFQWLPVSYGPERLPSPTTLPQAYIAMAPKTAPAASVQFLWTPA